MNRSVKLVRVVIICILLFIGVFKFQGILKHVPTKLIETQIVKVIDGDTIEVRFDGKKETVRMIGINTPESVHPDRKQNTITGMIASEYTKELLKEGSVVYLSYDIQSRDRYNRLLAYVWLSDQADTTSFTDFCNYNVGAILLMNTNCEASYYKPNGIYREWYEQLEEQYQ